MTPHLQQQGLLNSKAYVDPAAISYKAKRESYDSQSRFMAKMDSNRLKTPSAQAVANAAKQPSVVKNSLALVYTFHPTTASTNDAQSG